MHMRTLSNNQYIINILQFFTNNRFGYVSYRNARQFIVSILWPLFLVTARCWQALVSGFFWTEKMMWARETDTVTMVKRPVNDHERSKWIWEEHVLAQVDAYEMRK